MKNLNQQIFVPVFDKLNLLDNEICRKCNAFFRTPLIPWAVGEKYDASDYKVLFVGKPHRGDGVAITKHAFYLETDSDWFMKVKWPYWRYTGEIANRLYDKKGKEGWDYIALSNVIKCSSALKQDCTTKEMVDCCIKGNAVIWKEIEILKPKNIVFYTYKLPFGKTALKDIPFNNQLLDENDEPRKCGNKIIRWWTRTLMTDWGKMNVLVTYHPERLCKEDFVQMICEWVKGNTK